MIDFGMPTLIELYDIEGCAKLCGELGLQFIELNMNLPEYQLHIIDADKLNEIAIKYGIYYTIHLDESFNACDFNPLVANAYLETMIKTIELAKKLSAPVINMHMVNGVWFTMPDRLIYLFDKYNEAYMQKQREFKQLCEKEVGGSSIKICIENAHKVADYLDRAIEYMLTSDLFGLTFDIGHNASNDYTQEAPILKRKDKLCHFHFHDAIGKKNHLALGSGEIDLDRYLKLAKETNSRIVLETKTIDGLRKSAEWVRENFYDRDI